MKCYPSIVMALLLGCLLPGAQGQVTLFPANHARGVNPDTRLILTFDRSPSLETRGCIRIYDVADDHLVDTLDMSIPPGPHNTRTLPPYDSLTYEKYPEYRKLITYRNRFDPPDPNAQPIDYQINYIGGTNDGDAYHFYPVIIRDNRAIICPHNHVLDYDKTYRVEIESGVFSQVDEPLEWTFSTKKTPPSIDSTTLEVSCDGSGDFSTVQGAIDFVPDHHPEPITLFIKNGTYDEMVYFRNKSNVTFLGESRDQVVICNSNNSIFNPPTLNVKRDDVPDGNHNRRAVFGVERSNRINIVNLTLRSLGEEPAQAEGLLVKGKEIVVYNVTIDGSGDALQATGTIYVHDSSITGYGDNVLGYGAVFFDHCDFVSTYGPHLWIRNPATNHGNALVNCTLRTIGDVETVVARNPITGGHGFPDCEAVLINCALEGIRPEGWGPVGGDTRNMRYWEYNSTDLDGHPVDMSQRHEIVRELTMEHDAEIIANYSDPTYVLGGWTPAMKPRILSQPQDISVGQGESARLTVSVAAVPEVSYQWVKDGVSLAGATQETLTLDSVSLDDVGCYRVRVENPSGQINSEVAQLSLHLPESSSKTITAWLIGDSTMADYTKFSEYRNSNSPIAGWGQVFQPFMSGAYLEGLRPLIEADEVVVDDRAIGGRTTRSFFEEGHWRRIYDSLQPGDLVFIQFGHNDMGIKLPEILAQRGYPEFVDLGYKEYLRLYVSQAREKGAIPILLTPVARNYPWKDGRLSNVHGDFPESVMEVVEEMDVLFVDLNQLSMDFFSSKDRDDVTWKYFMNLKPGQLERYPDGLKDNTHFKKEGAVEVARLVYGGLKSIAQNMAQATPIPVDLACAKAVDTVVMTDAGPIKGCLSDVEGVKVFKGIPFAAPPVGQNRWREPQPVEPWSEVRDCTEFGPACPQSDILVRAYGIKAPVLDEDCLYLNVFTPAKNTNDKLPVMVWFYGGGFGVGDASTYDMTRFSQLGAVLVTINYRVGVMGFLAHESLSQESPHQVSGNYGLLDMVASLRWVQRNIDQFGGSLDNVTIFGQSAGASGVCYLMASPQAEGLFHKAISQSHGAYSLDPTLKMQEETGALFFQALGCAQADDPLAAARAKCWQEVFELSQMLGNDGQVLPAESRKPRIRFWPNIDGWLNVDASFLVFAAGHQANVPLLIGSNQDESDRTFTAGTRYFAQQHSRLNPQVYRYFFTQPSKSPFFLGKAAHAAEIAYFMRGNPVVANHFDDQDWALSDVISQAWVQFARTGNPNIEGKPFTWPQYDAEIDSYLELGLEIKPGIGIRSSICDQIDDEIRRAVVSRSAGH